jgi:uncharacterized membrane protein (DUF2068 family)
MRFVGGAEPAEPAEKSPPAREEVSLPLRGRPLRDRYVLRLIAMDRPIHLLVLSALAAALSLFATNKAALNAEFTRILNDLQGGVGGPVHDPSHGIVYELQRLFTVSITNLYLAGAAVTAYSILECAEAVGLWRGRRWAEYLTFIATVIFVPYEIYKLTKGISALKILALVISVAIVAYLLVAKRLFGLRGGASAERAENDADTGWSPIELATPRRKRGHHCQPSPVADLSRGTITCTPLAGHATWPASNSREKAPYVRGRQHPRLARP